MLTIRCKLQLSSSENSPGSQQKAVAQQSVDQKEFLVNLSWIKADVICSDAVILRSLEIIFLTSFHLLKLAKSLLQIRHKIDSLKLNLLSELGRVLTTHSELPE